MRDKKLFVVGYHNTDIHDFEAGTFSDLLCESAELMSLAEVLECKALGYIAESWDEGRDEDELSWNELNFEEQVKFVEKYTEQDDVMFCLFCKTEENAKKTLKEIEDDYKHYIDNTEAITIKQSQKTNNWEDVRTIKSKA